MGTGKIGGVAEDTVGVVGVEVVEECVTPEQRKGDPHSGSPLVYIVTYRPSVSGGLGRGALRDDSVSPRGTLDWVSG